jgi:hypothetical protein
MLAICRGGATGYGWGRESGRALSPIGVARLAAKRCGTPCGRASLWVVRLSSSGRCDFRLVREVLCLVRERLEVERVGCCERGGQELECLVAVSRVVAS